MKNQYRQHYTMIRLMFPSQNGGLIKNQSLSGGVIAKAFYMKGKGFTLSEWKVKDKCP